MDGIPVARIAQALTMTEDMPESLQVSIIAKVDIDLSQATEFTACYLNDAWAPKIKKLIEDDWIAFRIQTELEHYSDGQEHTTRIYFAKMKAK